VKQVISAMLALVLCLGFSLPVMAADNSGVDAKIQVLEQKYDIAIQYEKDPDGSACIGTGTLHTLDHVLEKITPGIVKQVSAHVREKTGRKLTYSFVYKDHFNFALPSNVEAHGVFYEERGLIEILLPSSSAGTYSSGDNPLALAHEFGHALEWVCRSRYGEEKLASEWKALNGGAVYSAFDGRGSYSNTTFVSLYASSSYHEDFAETFAHCVVRDRAGLGFYHLLTKDGVKTALGKKVDYLAALLPQCLQNAQELSAHLQKVYTTPIYRDFQNQRLTGVHMQYMGYSYPRYVLRGIMHSPEINEEIASSHWFIEIGGWYVVSTTGRHYLVYPGGVVRQQATALNTAA
jgi:hypothetical protein